MPHTPNTSDRIEAEERDTEMNVTDQIVAYEEGDLDVEQTTALFQELINSGMAWQLQGHYGRTAQNMIDAGVCRRPR